MVGGCFQTASAPGNPHMCSEASGQCRSFTGLGPSVLQIETVVAICDYYMLGTRNNHWAISQRSVSNESYIQGPSSCLAVSTWMSSTVAIPVVSAAPALSPGKADYSSSCQEVCALLSFRCISSSFSIYQKNGKLELKTDSNPGCSFC